MAGEQNRKFDGEVIKLFFEEIWIFPKLRN